MCRCQQVIWQSTSWMQNRQQIPQEVGLMGEGWLVAKVANLFSGGGSRGHLPNIPI